MVSAAVPYDVMLVKLLRATPQSQRLQILQTRNSSGKTILHRVTLGSGGHPALIKTILDLYPKSMRLQAVMERDCHQQTILHIAAKRDSVESLKMLILDLVPESQREQAVCMTNIFGENLFHCAARSGKLENINFILTLLSDAHEFWRWYVEMGVLLCIVRPIQAVLSALQLYLHFIQNGSVLTSFVRQM